MKIRSTLFLGATSQTLSLYSILQETRDHLLLKLAAAIFFHEQNPLVISSPQQHPALAGQDFAPDLMTADDTNQVTLWVECGKTTLHKLEKSSKRFRAARFWMLTAFPHEGRQMADALNENNLARMEVWSFGANDFARWSSLLGEQNDIIGEATESSMNLVVNGQVYVADLVRSL